MTADLLRTTRMLLERSLRRIRAVELSTGVPPDRLAALAPTDADVS